MVPTEFCNGGTAWSWSASTADQRLPRRSYLNPPVFGVPALADVRKKEIIVTGTTPRSWSEFSGGMHQGLEVVA